MDFVPGSFKASKTADNRQRRNLPKQPLKAKGQNEKQAELIKRVDEILQNSKTTLAQFRKSGYQPSPKKKARKQEVHTGNGYVYTYDEEGKPIPKSRVLMEEKLGRQLYEHEVIVYLDKDRRNCVIENLAIGFKGNSPITRLKCNHCGTVGEITLLPLVGTGSPEDPSPTS